MANRQLGFTRTRNDSRVGKRLEIPAYYDAWMRGARFGVVHSIEQRATKDPALTYLLVRMDHPQMRRLVRVLASEAHFV